MGLEYPPPLHLSNPSDPFFVEWLRKFSDGINKYKSIINNAYAATSYFPGQITTAPTIWTEVMRVDFDQVEGHAVETYVNASGFDATMAGLILWMTMEGIDGDNEFIDAFGQSFTEPATGNKISDDYAIDGLTSCRCIHAGQLYTNTPCPQLNLGTGDFTFEFWVYPPDESLDTFTLEFFYYPGYALSMGIDTDLKLFIYGGINGGSEPNDDLINYDEWNHVAFVRKSGVVKGYLNGVEQFSVSSSYNINYGGSTVFYAASHEANNIPAHEVYVDEFRVWNVARYESNFTPSTALGGTFDIRLLIDGAVAQQKLSATLTSDLNMTHLTDVRVSTGYSRQYTVEVKTSVAATLLLGEISMVTRFV